MPRIIITRRYEDEHGNVVYKSDSCPHCCSKRKKGDPAPTVCPDYDPPKNGTKGLERCKEKMAGDGE